MTHELKIWPNQFDAVNDGRNPWQLRKDDREPRYKKLDHLWLREWDSATKEYTGRSMNKLVTCIQRDGDEGEPENGIKPGWCLMAVRSGV